MSPPAQVDAALATFRELTTTALPAETRAQRLRTEVLLPLARFYADALQGDHRLLQGRLDASDPLPYHARATFAAARACLVILGSGRADLSPDTLREVLRLGEGFCDLHLLVLRRQDPGGHDKAGPLSLAQLHATLAMVGAESAGDLEAAGRARQRFAELGDETAVQACDRLILRLGGALDPADDPLRTVEMEIAPFALLAAGGAPDTSPVPITREDQLDIAETSSRPVFSELPTPVVARSAPPPPALPRSATPSTESLAAMPGEVLGSVIPPPVSAPPAGPPPLRPVARPNRGQEAQRPTVVVSVWPPLRNERMHALATAAVVTVLCVAGLLSFGAARRAAQAHRAERAAAAPAAVSALTVVRPTPASTSSAARPDTKVPAFSVNLAPPTATPPPTAAPAPAPPTEAAPLTDAPEAGDPPEPVPGELAEPARVRARRLNTEGFRAYEAGDRAAALTHYRKATQADPGFPLPWYNLACIEALEGRVEASLEALETFHRIDSEVDLHRRVETDRDFARVRDQPAFRQGLDALLRPSAPQVPAAH